MVSICFNKFFRLPICLGKDSLVVNSGRNSVSSMQFHSHKLLQSWVLKQPQSFSCPVVYDSHKKELLCVIDKNTLMIWDYEADNLDGAKKTKFLDNIFAIVSVTYGKVVVFNTGSCLMLEDAIEKHEFLPKSYLKNDEQLLWVDAATCESNFLIFLLTSIHKDEHKLHSLLLNSSDGQIVKSSEQVISRETVSLRSWCIKYGDVHPSFLILWSDGQVHSYSEDCKSTAHLLTVPGVEEDEQLAMEALDTCHIVVVRVHSSNGCSYEIWDTKYSTKKTSKSIASALSGNLQVKILGDTLFLPSSQKIVAEPLEVAFSTLAAVVGKSSNVAKVQENVIYSWTSDGMLREESAEEETCDDNSSSKFSTVTSNELFEELLARLHQADVETISSYLKEIKLISESKLVKLLKCLLRENHPDFNEEARAKGVSSKKASKECLAHIFLKFFYIPYDDIFLQQHLRKLTFKETVATLEVLYFLLNEHKPHTPHTYSEIDGWDFELRVIKWINVLKLSHFEGLLQPTEKEMSFMTKVSKTLGNKVDNIKEELDKVKHKKLIKFEHSTSTDYCIEILDL